MRRARARFVGVLLCLGVGLCIGQAAAAGDGPSAHHTATFHYDVHVGGILSGSVDVAASYDARGYHVVADTRSRGPVDLIIGFRSHAVTDGVTTGAVASPLTHRADNLWMGSTRWVQMRYGDGPGPKVEVFPSAEEDDRTIVPQAAREGTVDAITATYAMMLAAAGPERCSGMIKVFDGRRRYNLVGTFKGLQGVHAQLYRGKAARCDYAIVQLGGRQRHSWWPKSRDPKVAHVYFARLNAHLPPVGVRVDAAAGFIPVRLELTALSVDGVPIPAQTGAETPG